MARKVARRAAERASKMMDWKKQTSLIPDGVQTMSKMPCRYVEGVYPVFVDRAEGAYCYAGDKKYIDYPLALGPILLGHADRRVNTAIGSQMKDGWIYSLPHRKEGELAEVLCGMIPSFEMCRFLKSGTEACMAAVKLARAYTGKKMILTCGYHGWADWYSIGTQHPGGCPESRKIETRSFVYNNMKSFEQVLRKGVAAVMMEPYVFEGPKEGFLRKIRKMCRDLNVLLIFDEVVTGFRTLKHSAQAMYKVMPDITCVGKAMANGMPISAVGGRKDIIELLTKDTFVSSTFGGDLLSIAAALKTLEISQQEGVPEHIWDYGEMMQQAFNAYAEGMDGVECVGLPCRTFFNFPTEEHRSLFWQEAAERGVLFGYAQFVSQAHDRGELEKTYNVMEAALTVVRKNFDNPASMLKGKCARATLRLR